MRRFEHLPAAPLLYEEFTGHSALRSLRRAVQSRYWHIGIAEEAYHWRRVYPEMRDRDYFRNIDYGKESIDLELVLGAMRTIEAGDVRMSGFGEGSWNTYASVINGRLAPSYDEPPLVLPWQPGLHSRLRSWLPEVRSYAADQIEDLYVQVEAAYTALNNQ